MKQDRLLILPYAEGCSYMRTSMSSSGSCSFTPTNCCHSDNPLWRIEGSSRTRWAVAWGVTEEEIITENYPFPCIDAFCLCKHQNTLNFNEIHMRQKVAIYSTMVTAKMHMWTIMAFYILILEMASFPQH